MLKERVLRSMYASIDENTYEFRGSSKDKKPIGSNVPKESIDSSAYEQLKHPISTGSVFFEIDSGKTFMYMLSTDDANAIIGATWKEI